MKNRIRNLGGISFAALALAAWPAAAQAQTDDCDARPTPQERDACIARQASAAVATEEAGDRDIVVTGSRIARPNYDTLQPAVVLDSQQIEARGFETLGQAINELPAFGVPGASPVGAGQAGSFGSGQSFVNFLGLGDQRTLVLINGRRFISSNTSSIFGPSSAGVQVDLNAINTRLVERVETIAIGGAPIYGSDAIAGTVNIILRRDYEGFEIDGQYGISDQDDAENYRIRAIWGANFAGGRGNITASAEYNRGRGLVYNDRRVTAQSRFYGDCPAGSPFNQCLYNDRRIPAISESGILTVGGDVFGLNFPLSPAQSEFLVFGDPTLNFGVTDAQGRQLQFDTAGNLIPIDFGRDIGDVEGGDFNIDFEGGNGFNIANTSNLLTETERYNFNVLAHVNISDNVRVFMEAWYSFSKGVQLRNQPVYNSGLFDAAGTPDGPIILSIDNPFLTPAQRAIIQASIDNNPFSDQNVGVVGVQDYFYLSRANTDLIPARATNTTDIYRLVGGFDGSFELGGREYTWEVVGNFGRAEGEGREPALIQQNFENAVNPISATQCAPGVVSAPIPTRNPNCTPLNLFGQNRFSQAALDYVTTIADPSTTNEQWVFTASVAGPVASLPGGDLSVALGYEHRNESTNFQPGAFYFGGPDPDPTVDTSGDGDPTNDRVQFGRSIPIFPVEGSFNTDELFGEVTAEIVSPSNNVPGLYRLELHGAARYVDNNVAGGDWTWTVEGRWAPIRDITLRGNYTRSIRAPAIQEVFNPSSSFFGFATDPCDADELGNGPNPAARQANCLAAGVAPNFQSLANQRSFPQAIAGNVDLENERSRAWSVGGVLTPRWIPGLTLSADYLDIRLQNAISNFSATQTVAACYDADDFPNNAFCSRVSRDPASDQLDFVQTSFFNAAQFRYKGVLASLEYRMATPFLGSNSRIGARLSYQYLDELSTKATANSAPNNSAGEIGYSRHTANLDLNYENGPFNLNTSFNYIGPARQDVDEADGAREFQRIGDVVFINVGASYTFRERYRLRVVVDNILDQGPPFPVPAFGGAVTYFPGVLGRYFRVGASVSF
jgi:outer membrane receptor protein involved in Fe transport